MADRHTGIPSPALEGIKDVFGRHPDIWRATLYGSRAKGTHRSGSDIDLVLTAPELTWEEFNKVVSEIDDLLLPWKVDLALEHQIENQDLLDHIQRVGVVVYRSGTAGG
ncbi:nucleotidyltransferase domain-containing protein [Marinobacteraceae bacterium S3BR75-40.1]